MSFLNAPPWRRPASTLTTSPLPVPGTTSTSGTTVVLDGALTGPKEEGEASRGPVNRTTVEHPRELARCDKTAILAAGTRLDDQYCHWLPAPADHEGPCDPRPDAYRMAVEWHRALLRSQGWSLASRYVGKRRRP